MVVEAQRIFEPTFVLERPRPARRYRNPFNNQNSFITRRFASSSKERYRRLIFAKEISPPHQWLQKRWRGRNEKKQPNKQFNLTIPGSLPVRIGTYQRRRMYDRLLIETEIGIEDTILDVGVSADVTYESSNYLEQW